MVPLCRDQSHARSSAFFFFFQAEDGIRDYKVTGVQTCALPIWPVSWPASRPPKCAAHPGTWTAALPLPEPATLALPRQTPFHTNDRQTQPDRKSTRLNSSHLVISYAVFCLKKKKKKKISATVTLRET